MQKPIYVLWTALAVGGLLLATGCKSISTSHTCEIIGDRLPPSDPARIEVLSNAPVRRFARLGEVRAICNTEEQPAMIQTALRKEAAELGADAIVVLKQGINTDRKGGLRLVVIGVGIKYL